METRNSIDLIAVPQHIEYVALEVFIQRAVERYGLDAQTAFPVGIVDNNPYRVLVEDIKGNTVILKYD